MHTLLLCSANKGKLREMRALLPANYSIRGLLDTGHVGTLQETGTTLEQNALQKATYGHRITGLISVADDSGLEVHALGGAPGIHSADYSGSRSDQANIQRLLHEMLGKRDRKARFRTVIAVVHGELQHTFTGHCDGVIADHAIGTDGFGYDPIFIPEGYGHTFAEMNLAEKNKISHRMKAMNAFIRWLELEFPSFPA